MKEETKKVKTFASIFGDNWEENEAGQDTKQDTLHIEQLVAFENHPFKLYEGDRFNEMVESIKQFGVIVPIVVRKKKLKFEILSGHNRVEACKALGLKEIPAIVKEGLTEEEALLIVTETNTMQRSFGDLPHSERATVIAVRHEAMKKQGVRTDLLEEIERLSKSHYSQQEVTFPPMGEKLHTVKNLGSEYNLSKNSISRYLRISKLPEEFKELIDTGQIAIRAGVDLSYLSHDNQEMVEAIISENTFKVDMKKAASLRVYDKNGQLTWDIAKAIISGEINKKEKKPTGIKIQHKIISKYFRHEEDKKDIENIIEKALAMYFSKIKEVEVTIEEEEECEQI
ncbi:ParB N-terminal domain-containing protein [Lutibacter sp. B2]|nr:ParB N-terminal domain-containing protein [Lutibacter sp. B2]